MPLAALMLLGPGPGINAAIQRASRSERKHSQLSYYNSRAPISNVEVKNIKSAGCVGFTQLKKTLPQHVVDM